MTVAIDFDGSVVTHEFPQIGKDIGAVPVLKELVANGHKLILFTMRSDKEKVITTDDKPSDYLTQAVKWFESHDIPLWGINQNPEQHTWTSSPKPYAHLYIDDAALGTPLAYEPIISQRLFVDWEEVRKILVQRGFIK